MATSAATGTERPHLREHFLAAGARDQRWTGLEIETQGGHCTARWHDRTNPAVLVPGLGLALDEGFALARSGRRDGTQGMIGLVEYALDPAGGLSARWVHPSLGTQIGTGAAERTGGEPGGFAGTYQITYRDADGTQVGPVCLLRIEPHEEAYALRWAALQEERALFEGIGRVDDRRHLLAAWGGLGEPCNLVVLHRSTGTDGAELDGWAIGARSPEPVEERYAPGR